METGIATPFFPLFLDKRVNKKATFGPTKNKEQKVNLFVFLFFSLFLEPSI